MLVLSRKKNEGLVLGVDGEIVVTIIEIRGDKVRIGIETKNKETTVHRREVWEAIRRESTQKAD